MPFLATGHRELAIILSRVLMEVKMINFLLSCIIYYECSLWDNLGLIIWLIHSDAEL